MKLTKQEIYKQHEYERPLISNEISVSSTSDYPIICEDAVEMRVIDHTTH